MPPSTSFHFYLGFFEHSGGQLITISIADNYSDNAGIDDHLGANNTGLIGAVKR